MCPIFPTMSGTKRTKTSVPPVDSNWMSGGIVLHRRVVSGILGIFSRFLLIFDENLSHVPSRRDTHCKRGMSFLCASCPFRPEILLNVRIVSAALLFPIVAARQRRHCSCSKCNEIHYHHRYVVFIAESTLASIGLVRVIADCLAQTAISRDDHCTHDAVVLGKTMPVSPLHYRGDGLHRPKGADSQANVPENKQNVPRSLPIMLEVPRILPILQHMRLFWGVCQICLGEICLFSCSQ